MAFVTEHAEHVNKIAWLYKLLCMFFQKHVHVHVPYLLSKKNFLILCYAASQLVD